MIDWWISESMELRNVDAERVCANKSFRIKCESGEIGRRTRLRIWRGNPWGFKSPLSHHPCCISPANALT